MRPSRRSPNLARDQLSRAEVRQSSQAEHQPWIDLTDPLSVIKSSVAFFQNLGFKHWEQGHWFRAWTYWIAPVVVIIFMTGVVIWAFPIRMEISRGLRQIVYMNLRIRPPFGDFFPRPTLAPKFLILDPKTRESRPALDGMVCYSHEIIVVSVKLEEPTNLLVFGLDGHQPYRMTDSPLAVQNRAVGDFRDAVQLDSTEGDETIYVIASSLPFSFEQDVGPALAMTVAASRGGRPTHAALPLSSQLQQAAFTCHHKN